MAKVQDQLEEDQNESVICFKEGAKPLIEEEDLLIEQKNRTGMDRVKMV